MLNDASNHLGVAEDDTEFKIAGQSLIGEVCAAHECDTLVCDGYGPDSYKFAGGKPLNLIDGNGLLALCLEHNIPARILDRGKGKKHP